MKRPMMILTILSLLALSTLANAQTYPQGTLCDLQISAQDNSATLNACIASAARYGTVLIPAGTYNFTNSVSINNSAVVLSGAGAGTTTLQFGSMTNAISIGGGNMFNVLIQYLALQTSSTVNDFINVNPGSGGFADSINIKDVNCAVSGGGTVTGSCVNFVQNVYASLIEDLFTYSMTGVTIGPSSNANTIANPDINGIFAAGQYGVNNQGLSLTITGGTIEGNIDAGGSGTYLLYNNGGSVVSTGVHYESSTSLSQGPGTLVYDANGYGMDLEGGRVFGPGATAVYMADNIGSKVSGAYIAGTFSDGNIVVPGVNYGVGGRQSIDNNIIVNTYSGAPGVSFAQTLAGDITDNSIYVSNGTAIQFAAGSFGTYFTSSPSVIGNEIGGYNATSAAVGIDLAWAAAPVVIGNVFVNVTNPTTNDIKNILPGSLVMGNYDHFNGALPNSFSDTTPCATCVTSSSPGSGIRTSLEVRRQLPLRRSR